VLVNLIQFLRRWHQFAVPDPFRISPMKEEDWIPTLLQHLKTDAAELQRMSGLVDKDASNGNADAQLAPDFVIGWCNAHFRAQKNLNAIDNKNVAAREVRGMTRALEATTRLMEEHQVQCLDLTNQEFDDGRMDFEPLAEPDEVEGLECVKITLCERPAVLHQGRLIQKAKGLLARPA